MNWILNRPGIGFRQLLLTLIASSIWIGTHAQTCGVDVFIANDQSATIMASENKQGRLFVRDLANSLNLGNGNNQSRVAIAEWADANTWSEFTFPIAGANYTTHKSDIINYATTVRTINGGSDVYQALKKTYDAIKQTPITGRRVPRIIVLITAADCSQTQPAIVELATKIKASGVYIMLVGLHGSAACPTLTTTKVGSPGMRHVAVNHVVLISLAQSIITDMVTEFCTNTTPGFDLGIALTTLNCTTGGTNYTVSNTGNAAFSGTVNVSFYDGHPSLASTRLITSIAHAGQNIAAGGSLNLGTINLLLANHSTVYAAVNLSTVGTNEIPPMPYDFSDRLAVATEAGATNNISAPFSASGCAAATPRLEVTKTFRGLSCDSMVTYQVKICNTGTATATNIEVKDLPPIGFTFSAATASFTPGSSGTMSTPPALISKFFSGSANANGTDDGYSNNANSYVGNTATTGNILEAVTTVGWRWTANAGTGVPPRSAIRYARMSASATHGSPGFVTCNWGFQNHPNPGPFTNTDNPFTRYTSTTGLFTGPTAGNSAANTGGAIACFQTVVGLPGYTSSSAIVGVTRCVALNGVTSVSYDFSEDGPGKGGNLFVDYLRPAIISQIEPGECATITYIYNASAVDGGIYESSVDVVAAQPATVYAPHTNFTAHGITANNGYNGAASTGEEVTIPGIGTGCTQTPQPLTTTVDIIPTSSCGTRGNYITATVTINNPNTASSGNGPGITIFNANERLNLTGTGATYAGEPYEVSAGLQLAKPDVLNVAYPAVDYALYGTSGIQNLPLYRIPPGTSSFKIDISVGSNTVNLSSTVNNLHTTYNTGGTTTTASDATGVTIITPPIANITTALCGGATTISATSISLTGTTLGSVSAQWESSTDLITNTGTVQNPAATYTINDYDRANGYVDFSLQASSVLTCDVIAYCRVLINGAAYDYGDLPASYDLNKTSSPYAAAAYHPFASLRMGALNSDAEATPIPGVGATGDNTDGTNDEDGVVSFPAITPATTSYTVAVTASNSSGDNTNLIGWIDWNNDGQFGPDEASTPVAVFTGANNSIYNVTWTGITPTPGMLGYARFRIATELTVYDYNGISYGGEVEDYRILATPLPLELIAFKAAKQAANGLLSWTTANETNTKSFEVEHSLNAQDFELIGTLSAAGNSKAERSYSYFHHNPGSGVHYYRLKMIDRNGSHAYSPLELLNFGNSVQVLVYPNPSSSTVAITGLNGKNEIRISNALGQQMSMWQTESNGVNLDISNYPNGVYILQVINERNETAIIRLIKR